MKSVSADAAHARRQRRGLIGLALLFFAPLGVSFYLYYGPLGWRPEGRVNHGTLVDPARPLPDVSLPAAARGAAGRLQPAVVKGKWTLLYVGAGNCSALCRTDLYNTRQVRMALNREMDRVRRVFIAEGECCDWTYLETQHPDLVTLRGTPDAAPLLAALPSIDGIPAAGADRIYLVDPLGNLMMSFGPGDRPKGLLEDLKRLLGLSHVG